MAQSLIGKNTAIRHNSGANADMSILYFLWRVVACRRPPAAMFVAAAIYGVCLATRHEFSTDFKN